MSTCGGASRPRHFKKKSCGHSIISSSKPIPLGQHESILLLQTKVMAGQSVETLFQAAAFGLRSKILKSHQSIALLESGHPGRQSCHFGHRRPSVRGIIRIVGHGKGKVFLLRNFFLRRKRSLYLESVACDEEISHEAAVFI